MFALLITGLCILSIGFGYFLVVNPSINQTVLFVQPKNL